MRLAQYMKKGTGFPRLAVWNTKIGNWVDADIQAGTTEDESGKEIPVPLTMDDILTLEEDDDIWNVLIEQADDRNGKPIEKSDLYYLPPILSPSKILCVGLNYADHAAEFGDPIPPEPVFFCKANSSLNCQWGGITIPKVSDKIDYEAELVVIIGRQGRDIPEKEALDYVFGYTCGNDVSCRDWQSGKPAGQWFLGKSFDSFAPIGPALVTKDEIDDPNRLAICSRLNGRLMQSSNTRNFIFKVEQLIAYASQVMTLYPGDILFTGTPGGVGVRRNPPVFLRPKDTIEVEIEGIGTLTNIVRSDEENS